MLNLSPMPPAQFPVYLAVMRCPLCQSARTEVVVTPSEHTRDGVPIDVVVKWKCADCKRLFSPPNHLSEKSEYVLMCGRCARPGPHVFRKVQSRNWKEPAAASQNRAAAVWVEIYACEACGTEREYGLARPPIS